MNVLVIAQRAMISVFCIMGSLRILEAAAAYPFPHVFGAVLAVSAGAALTMAVLVLWNGVE